MFYAVVCTVKLTQEMSRRRQHEDASLWLWRQRDDFELFETSSILLFGVLPGSTALQALATVTVIRLHRRNVDIESAWVNGGGS